MKQPIETSPPPFPIGALPEKTRVLVGEIQGVTQASTSTIVSAIICTISAAAQGSHYIEHEDRKITRPQLFFISIDDTVTAKQEIFRRVFHGLYLHDQKIKIAFQAKLLDHYRRKDQLLRYIDQRLQAEPPPTSDLHLDKVISQLNEETSKIQNPRFVYDSHEDPQLLEKVSQAKSRIVLINPEADAMFSRLSLKNLDLLSRLWGTEDLATYKPLLGESMIVTSGRSRATIFLSARSKALAAYLANKKKTSTGEEFLERCLFSISTVNAIPTMMTPDTPIPVTDVCWLPMFEMIINTIISQSSAKVPLDEPAQQLLDDCTRHYNASIPAHVNSAKVQAYISRQIENTSKIALALHLIETYLVSPRGTLFLGKPITESTMISAISIVTWHFHVHLWLTSPEYKNTPTATDNANKLKNWLGAESYKTILPSGVNLILSLNRVDFDRTHIRKFGPIRDSTQLKMALNLLEIQGTVFLSVTPSRKNVVSFPLAPLWGTGSK